MTTSDSPTVQPERRRTTRWLPIMLMGAAAVCGAAAASEQIMSKVSEVRQAGILMSAGNTPIAGFSYPHTELTSDQQTKVAHYQEQIDANHHDRDIDWTLAVHLTELTVVGEAARLILRAQEARITTMPMASRDNTQR